MKSLKSSALLLAAVFGLAAQVQAAPAAKPAVLTVATQGDNLAFDKTKLAAKPGQVIKLTFVNKASKNSNMQHNWVLVNPGTSQAVGMASMGAAATGYVAASPDVLAHTKLLNPGEKETIEFKAPEKPGEYEFICTFPGHFSTMKGVLSVK